MAFTSAYSFRFLPSRVCSLRNNVFSFPNHGNLFSKRTISSSTSLKNSYSYTILDEPLPDESSSTNQTKRNFQHVLQTAEKAAYEAGKIMIQTSGKIAVKDTKTNTADLVTESDYECQRVIKEIITKEFQSDYFLGEEDVEPGSFSSSTALANALKIKNKLVEDSGGDNQNNGGNEKLLFIVDPIDGTTNFQAGLPMFCVSIGVVSLRENIEPQVVAGVIYNPILNEMMSAVRGRGCYLNGKRLDQSRSTSLSSEETSEGISLDKAMINVGFPVYSEGTLRVSSATVTALATKVRGLRMIASASQVMSWIAQGKLNAYVSWDLNAWDIAAGMVIVEECGGFISDFEGKKASIITRDMIISSNEGNGKHELSNSILEIMKENNCLVYQ